MTSAEDKARLKKLVDSASGYKSWVTRTISEGEADIENLLTGQKPRAVSTLEATMDKVEMRYNKLEDHLAEIMELDPEQTDDLFAELDVYSKRKRKFALQAQDALSKAKVPGEQPLVAPRAAPAAAAAAAAAAVFKPNLAAKPKDKLTKMYQPSEMRKWVEQFKTYFNTSRMDVLQLPDQHVQLYLELDEPLADYLRTEVNDRTPMFSNNPSRHQKLLVVAPETLVRSVSN